MLFNSILFCLLTVFLLFTSSYGSASFTLSTFTFPQTTLGPYGSSYIRVDIPPWFSAVSVVLTSDVVDLDVARIERVPKSSLPIICFRDGSPPLPDALNTSLKLSTVLGINGLDIEQCFPMEKNITMKLTNELISPGAWYIGVFNGFGAARTQSRMIIRGPSYSFSANISVEACTNSMMSGQFCNTTVNSLSCTASSLKSTMKKPRIENAMTCKSNFETLCVEEGVPNLYSLDITNAVEEFTIMAGNIKLNITSSSNASGASDVKLLCFARHGAMPTNSLYDYSSDLNKSALVIHSPLIGRWYIRVLPVNLTKTIGDTHDSDAKACYSLESQMLQCPFGKAGPNCTISSYILQTVLKRSTIPFESYYLPIGEGASSAKFPLEPLLNNSSKFGETNETWTYFTLDIPHGAAGRNIHIQLSSDTKISYEVYARFGGLPSVDIRDYYYANKTSKSDQSVFFMLNDSSDKNIDFYLIYAREGTWSFGVRHVNTSSDSLKQKTILSISLEGCPNQCSSHGNCKYFFDATGLTSYSFCECDRNHGGFDCSIEIVSHKGHILQSIFLIGSNAAALLPAYWSLRQKAFAEWILFSASGIASGIYHACDVGTWCALNFSVLQFMDFWLSFMAVISTFVYLATIDEVHKRAIHTAVSIFTALIAVTNATRSSNVVYVIVIGVLGLLIGWLIEMSSKYRSSSFSFEVSPNFHQSLLTIKLWFYNLVKALIRRFRWGFILAGFAALIMAGIGWILETSETYWIWHSFWHAAIYTSSFFFLCSKADIGDAENQPPRSESYELARQDSFSREY
ncbi:unnamed protein product [Vicia faba]|uniref:EGF-like domain-containing protein n=1 Tax=Vicia faba TaxID=3906 RepID=A0AAV1ADG6_VICFA|nr:unnamed protein product [Vicia faba]